MEQLFALDFEFRDGALAGRGEQPVDEGLAFLRLHMGVTLGIHQNDAVGVAQPRVAFKQTIRAERVNRP